LSDVQGKHTGNLETIELAKRIVGYWPYAAARGAGL
jgi:hypothetical protein